MGSVPAFRGMILIWSAMAFASSVSAHPLSLSLAVRSPQTDNPIPLDSGTTSDNGGGGGGGSGMPTALWAPIVLVPFVLLVAMVVFRKTLLPKLAWFGQAFFPTHTSVPSTSSSNNGSRTFTAEQLAGSMAVRQGDTPGSRPATGTATAGAPTARRARRRPRRTPSQISTKSLPAYNAEAGDQEFVLARARHDAPDEHDEDEAEAEADAEDDEQAMASTPLLTDPNGSPTASTMQDHQMQQHSVSNSNPSIRPSMDSHMSSNDSHNTNRSSLSLLDRERGEAPAYFEVVGETGHPSNTTTTNTTNHDTERNQPASAPPSSFRVSSAFRRLFPWGGNPTSQSTEPSQPMQQYQQSPVSLPSTYNNINTPSSPPNNSQQLPGGRARRPSHSLLPASPSLSSLLLSRTRSGSNAQLPNPNASHTNISSPLPHSLIRTNFAYPTAGATPEQISFLSSTASLLRFGVPINQDGTEDTRAPPSFSDIVPTHASTTTVGAADASPRPRAGSSASRVPAAISTRNLNASASLASLQEQPTPISPQKQVIIEGLPPSSSGGAMDLVAQAAFVPLPMSAISEVHSPERLPLPASDAGHDEGGIGGGPRRTSGSTVNTFETAGTHLSGSDDESDDESAGDETETETGTASLRRTSIRATTPSPIPTAAVAVSS